MLKNKLKNSKTPKAPTTINKALEKSKLNSWAKVKIKGNVISQENIGLEGLIGLEVLKNYDSTLIKTNQAKFSRKRNHTKSKKLAPNSKEIPLSESDEDMTTSSDSDDEEEVNEIESSIKKSRKQAFQERIAKKLEKRLTKKEQRKLKRKQNVENHQTEDRFKFIRPPPFEIGSDVDQCNSEENVEQREKSKLLDIDDLEASYSSYGWNGMGVPDSILKALAEKGFKSPTEIQNLTLPAAILGKKDILGAAETGSGKTLAFGIPILAGIMELQEKNISTGIRKPLNKNKDKNKSKKRVVEDVFSENIPITNDNDDLSDNDTNDICNNNSKPLYALILTPTRELAVQIKNHLMAAAKYTNIKVAAIFGGLSVEKQERLLNKRPEIIVATPGRFWELFQQDQKHLRKLDEISFLVIDETDRMVEKGHFEELKNILSVLNNDEQKKQARQNFVFSATLTLVHDLPEHMQRRNFGKRPRFITQTSEMKLQSLIEELGISQPKIVDITRKQQLAQNLTECRLACPIECKDYYLYYFVQRHPGRTIVFCNSIDCVKRLATLFGILDCQPLPLHANMAQKQRLKNMEKFCDQPCGLLIATDVAARGLDIPNVEHVIHYQVPRTSENYIHRSGRTARANKNGITVIIMEPGELKSYVKLCKTLKKTEDLPLFPISEHYLKAVKERVDLAREVDHEELKLKRVQTEMGWMKKHAEEMDMVIDGYNDENASDQDEDAFVIERRRNRMNLLNARLQLKTLLAQPIFPKSFSFKYPTASGHLQMPEISRVTFDAEENAEDSAIKVMQDTIKDIKKAKMMRNKKKKT
uniref:ATP-dependent RNA helicase n=1 Tax=Glossina brevipalpis TaxID=37001 RepID=A0A1A9WIT4_9MUSC